MTSIHRSHRRHHRHPVKHNAKQPARAASPAAKTAAKAKTWGAAATGAAAAGQAWQAGASRTAKAQSSALTGVSDEPRSSSLLQTATASQAATSEPEQRSAGLNLKAPFQMEPTAPAAAAPPAAPAAPEAPAAPAPVASGTAAPVQAPPPARAGLPPLAQTGGLNDKAKALVAGNADLTQLAESAAPKLEGKKVLMLGDSHSTGEGFGSRFDALLRASGADTHTITKSNSKPDWFVNGTTGHWGEEDRAANGRDRQGNGLDPVKLDSILKGPDKPDVMVVALGANFRGQGQAAIQKQVDMIADRAKAAGVKLMWLGPPNNQKDTSDHTAMNTFNQQMARALGDRGTYIPSSPFTPKYPTNGADSGHEHYWGKEGIALANKWANQSYAAFANAL
jgi:hypothetical protein